MSSQAAQSLTTQIPLEAKHFVDSAPGNTIWIALVILGVVGLGAGGIGAAGFGAHHGLWSVFKQLGQTNAIVMMGVGGGGGIILLIGGIIGWVKNANEGGRALLYDHSKLETKIGANCYSFVLQRNGKYALLAMKQPQEAEALTPFRLYILKQDIEPAAILKNEYNAPYGTQTYAKSVNCMGYAQATSLLPAEFNSIMESFEREFSGNPELRGKILELLNCEAFKADPKSYILKNCPDEAKLNQLTQDPTLKAWHYIWVDSTIRRLTA